MIRLVLRIFRVLLRALIELIMGVLIFVGFSPALVGIAIIGFQVFVWLATETWTPIPLADAIETARVDLHLMDHSPLWPSMAKGLRASLNEIPLSSCFVAAGLFLSACLAYVRCRLVDRLVVRSWKKFTGTRYALNTGPHHHNRVGLSFAFEIDKNADSS